MKPDTSTAMQQIIGEARKTIPFGLPEAELCSGTCRGCSKKLLEFLDQELVDWSEKLSDGAVPTLGDVSRLAKTARKIHRALDSNGLV